MHRFIMVIGVGMGLAAAPLRAQAPDWYHWHDRVMPTVSVDVSLAPSGDFLYRYTVTNGPAAEQRIETLRMELPVTPTALAAPPDWEFSFDASTPVVGWWAVGDPDPDWTAPSELDAHMPSTLSEIHPGEALAGFEVLSPCGPGDPVTFYARGYAPVSYRPGDYDGDWVSPPWRDDAVSGTVTGPGDCSTVRDWGNRRPAVDGFVGLVGFADGDALPAGPVVVQLRFARAGETVHTGTLEVELNRTDVTAEFGFNSRGDAVAVFPAGSPPLQSGRNVLLVSIDGIVPGTSRTATDSDRFTFTLP